ncbi:hypothetical protein PSPO01_04645 [Paraphaeosphaeria sporulosa]
MSPESIERALCRSSAVQKFHPGLEGEIADEGYESFDQSAPESFSDERNNAFRRKLYFHLLPLMCGLYGLNYVDKVAIVWAVPFS